MAIGSSFVCILHSRYNRSFFCSDTRSTDAAEDNLLYAYDDLLFKESPGIGEKMGPKPENVELTVLCLIQDGNKLLLQNRVKEDWKGYTFPGGHVEPGESFVDACKREMKEETGLDIINPRLVGMKQFPIDGGRYVVLLFKATEFTGEVVSSEEGEMEWIEADCLSETNTVEDFMDLLKVINNPNLTEFQYIIEDGQWIAYLK